MSELKGKALAQEYQRLLSIELGGPIHAEHLGPVIEISGSSLPVHPQHPHPSTVGWTLGDRKKVAHVKEYVANRGCVGQWVAYDPHHERKTA